MRRRSWLLGLSLAIGACYEVGDLREVDDAGSGGSVSSGGNGGGWSATGGVGGVGGVGGGTSGTGGSAPPDAAVDSPLDVQTAGAAGGESDGSAGAAPIDAAPDKDVPDAVVAPWLACKPLGFGGACIGKTTLIYHRGPNACGASVDDTCYVNRCASVGGYCTSESCSNGFACTIYTGLAAEPCVSFGQDGACVDNVAIRANSAGTDCEFKDCEALSLTCVDGPTAPADCF